MNQHGVRERVNELKEANSRKATLSREQAIEFLCNVISTSAAKVEADSRSCNQRIRGRQARETQDPRQDRGGQGTDQDMWLGAAAYRTVGQGHAGGIYQTQSARRGAGQLAMAERGGLLHAEDNGERG